jgi:hypothetical protein
MFSAPVGTDLTGLELAGSDEPTLEIAVTRAVNAPRKGGERFFAFRQ